MVIEGEIAYFGLKDWWLNDLTINERNTILSVYKPLIIGIGIGVGKSSLISGKICSSSGTAIGLLIGLSSWFKKPEHREISYKIIKQAEKLVSDNTPIMDLHFLYHAKMQVYYRNRDNDQFALSSAIEACNQQIAISEKVKEAFKKEMGFIPGHPGYTQLCIIMEKQKKFDEVIRLSKIAKEQGWAGDWDRRIEKCERKIKLIDQVG